MSKTKLTSLLFALLVALLAVPFVGRAQVAPADITTMRAAEQQLRNLRNSLGSSWSTDAGYQAQLQAVANQCETLGDRIYAITGGEQSTTLQMLTIECTVGNVSTTGAGTSAFDQMVGRTLYTVNGTGSLQSFISGQATGSETRTLTAQLYDTITRQQLDSTNESAPNWFNQAVSWIISGIGNILASIMAGLATIAIWILNETVSYTTSAAQPAVVGRTWVIVRDFMNMFFIVALIAMALATILRIEAYNYRRLIMRLVLMALLINFSKVIAETLIGFSDTLIALFLPQAGFTDYFRVIYQGFVTSGGGVGGFFGQGTGSGTAIGEVVAKLVGLTILTISLFAVALLMFVRMIGLWFMLMISPVAYGLNIIPATQRFASQWWGTFIKYLIWGPVAMFFFRVSFVMLRDQGTGNYSDHILNFIFISAFLWGGFVAARTSGMIGSSSIVSGANKALGKAKSWGYAGAGAAGNYLAVRGTAQRHLGTLGERAGWLSEGTGKRWGENWGKATAWVGNQPKLVKQRFVDDPNKARKKLVEGELRRNQIRRSYFKVDDDNVKKVGGEDTAYMIQSGKWDESNLRNIVENGTSDAKMAVLQAYRNGHVRVTPGKFEQAQYDQLFQDLREETWKMAGGEKGAAGFDTYMTAPTAAEIDRHIVARRKSGYSDTAPFADQIKNSYFRATRPRTPRRQRGQQAQGQNIPAPAQAPAAQPAAAAQPPQPAGNNPAQPPPPTP